MNKYANQLKQSLTSLIREMSSSPTPYVKIPETDFTRKKEAAFETVIQLVISTGGNSLYKKLLESLDYDVNTATTSAFVQQRNKILPFAVEFLFLAFTESYMDTKGFNLLHLNAAYYLCNRLYVDALVQPRRLCNEGRALANMVDRSPIKGKTIADRGYESYNNFAHLERKGWNYVMQVNDLDSNGILSACVCPLVERLIGTFI